MPSINWLLRWWTETFFVINQSSVSASIQPIATVEIIFQMVVGLLLPAFMLVGIISLITLAVRTVQAAPKR